MIPPDSRAEIARAEIARAEIARAAPEEARRRDRLIGLFLAGAVLFDPPLLTLFSGATWHGWPLLYVYLFLVWAGLIAAVATIAERRRRLLPPADEA
jgi:MFS family permease